MFDSIQISQTGNLEPEKLRIAFVVYGAMNRRDWRTVAVDEVQFDTQELTGQLTPMLRGSWMTSKDNARAFGLSLVEKCRESLSAVLPLNLAERTFLDLLLDKGQIDASLLSDDPDLQVRIGNQPLLQWKAHHVRKHKGYS